MNTTKPTYSTPDNEGVIRVLGACAVAGMGLVGASLMPAASPLIIFNTGLAVGRIINHR
jgi:hypothetical protein